MVEEFKPRQHTQAEADVIFNRANIALARSQRLIESWTGGGASPSGAELPPDDDGDDFKVEPETLGLGARAKDDDIGFGVKRKIQGSNSNLLEQLIGKKAARGHMASKSKPDRTTTTTLANTMHEAQPRRSGGQQMPNNKRTAEAEHDSDDEGGRAASIQSKRRSKNPIGRVHDAPRQITHATGADPGRGEAETQPQGPPDKDGGQPGWESPDNKDSKRSKKKSRKIGPETSYLDQVLAEKASKRQRKSRS